MTSQTTIVRLPLAQEIRDRSMSGAVGLICDVRLGILLTCELILITNGTSIPSIVSLFVTMSLSWILLRTVRRAPAVASWGRLFPCTDLIVTGALVFTLSDAFNGAYSLTIAYILTSALLIGIITSATWAAVWTTGILTILIMMRPSHAPLPSAISIISILGIAAGVLLGNRLFVQLQEVGRLTAEAAAARAEERALTERLTIARDLHDSLAKSIHGIRMLAETLDDSLHTTDHEDAVLSRTLFESADEASREARLVLDGLRSGGDEDIISALIEEATKWGARTGLSVSVNCDGSNTPLPGSTEAMWQLQRILGEVLTNIEKHAHATSVDLFIFHDDNCFGLDVRDDGIGLSRDFKDLHREGHYGLAGLKERSETLNGTFTIDSPSELTAGTRVQLRVPTTSLHTTTDKEKSI